MKKSNKSVKMKKPIVIMKHGKIINKAYFEDSWIARFERDNAGLDTLSITEIYRGWQIGESFDGRDTMFFAVNDSGYTLTSDSLTDVKQQVDEYILQHDNFTIQPDPEDEAMGAFPQPMVASTKKMNKSKPSAERFEQVITDFIKRYSDDDFDLGDYTFHDYDDKVVFSFDSDIYELINYGLDMSEFGGSGEDYSFKEGLEQALEDAGFSWGEDIEVLSYSEWAYFKNDSTSKRKKGYVPEMPSFRDMVDKMRNTRNFRF